MALAFRGILRLFGQYIEAEVIAGEQMGFQPFEHGRRGSALFRLGSYGFRFVANGVHHLFGGFLAEPFFPEFKNHFLHVFGYLMFFVATNIYSKNAVLQFFSQALVGKSVCPEDVGSISFKLSMYWDLSLVVFTSSHM